jgi:hypothetical protein
MSGPLAVDESPAARLDGRRAVLAGAGQHAGTGIGRAIAFVLGDGTALDTDEAVWDRVLEVNLKGMWRVTKALLPQMISQRSAFPASDDSRYVSGALLPVDGALVASIW